MDKFAQLPNQERHDRLFNCYIINQLFSKKAIVNLLNLNYNFVMRIFLALLVFAIGFSGFSAVAHTFDSQSCAQILSAENLLSSNMDCAGHANGDKKQEKSSKDGKHLCLGCGHCCVSHATIIQHNLNFDTSIIKTAFSFIHMNVDDNVISGLKRPPKALV